MVLVTLAILRVTKSTTVRSLVVCATRDDKVSTRPVLRHAP